MKKQCKGKMMRHRSHRLMHNEDDSHPQFIMDKEDRKEAIESISLWSDEGFEKD